MIRKKDLDAKNISRGKFLGFLGKIGILSIISGIPVFGAESYKPKASMGKDSDGGQVKFRKPERTKFVKSLFIRGKTLSNEALTAKLATDNLENIRDVLTGRFFGKAAEEAFKDGYVPLINWKLGTDGSDLGCFLFADIGLTPVQIDNCGVHIRTREVDNKILIDIVSTSYEANLNAKIGSSGSQVRVCPSQCPGQTPCPNHCADKCSGTYCSGTYCSPKGEMNLGEIVSYPGDKFASEIMEILETTDVGVIQRELRDVIFSDDVLNMGLMQFMMGAHAGISHEFGNIAAGT